jgi:glycosyltransferase involved in cell wall biosynthesis
VAADCAAPSEHTRITVITVTRNNLDGLRRTFASLAAQDFRYVQHVVIDGGSSDGSVEWLATNRVFEDTVVVSEPDNGVYDAMNKGARLATGELLNFLNAGDVFAHPGVLSQVAASHVRDRWQWGFGLARVVDSAGRPIRPVWPRAYSLRRHALGLIRVSHQATFMRTELFHAIGGFDRRFKISGDMALLLRAGSIAPPWVWDSVDVLSASGGLSEARVFRGLYEQYRARRSIPAAGLGPWPLDLLWTIIRMAVTAARRTGKRVLDWLSGGRFTRWWAARGL